VSTTSTGSSSLRSREALPAVPERAADIAAALEALGIRPSRRWGQSFLLDAHIADAVAVLATPPRGVPVVEIGGGLGVLTVALLRRGIDDLTVVERDPRLAAGLRATFGDRVRVVEGDALEVDLPREAIVAGNLPFSSATPILLRFFARRAPRVVALVQSEVARRLAAPEGSRAYGRLSIVAALYGSVEGFQEVPASSFFPSPEVRARIIVHTARAGPLPVPDVPRLEGIVRVLFSARRKQLANLLPRLLAPSADGPALAEAAGWPSDWPRLRPENLAPEAFFRLATLTTSKDLRTHGTGDGGIGAARGISLRRRLDREAR
jgi:16S rRNA (adenine1518-N6/adenine1519-N6)-dimethyltransferase